MEVDQVHFWHQLLPLLKAISNASFVTVDVEMSGISTRARYAPTGRFNETGKPSLQEQYEDTKEAAERYRILQIGLTCVEEDRKNGVYVARPYNFYISPLLEDGDRLDIYRDITLSSSAMHFLRRNNFDVGAVFTKGISYVSRDEQFQAKQTFRERLNRNSSIPDLDIHPGDQTTLNFYRNVRRQLQEWTHPQNKDVQKATSFYNVSVPGGLNGYQRRLVYQLVRTEFTEYRAFLPRKNADFVQVEKMDAEKEARIIASKTIGFDAQISKQIGFRWIFEALAGGDISKMEPSWFCIDSEGQSAFTDTAMKKLEISAIAKALEAKSRVLVGHNLFTDLIFIYKTFIGSLPDTVVEFQQKVNELFPLVIDTKYMATQENLLNSRQASSLQDLHENLKSQQNPKIRLAEGFEGYETRHALHEAGYDSWLTAQIFLKISAKLQAGLPVRDLYIDRTQLDNPGPEAASLVDGMSSDGGEEEDGGVKLDLSLDMNQKAANRFHAFSAGSPVKKKAKVTNVMDTDIEDDMRASLSLDGLKPSDEPRTVAGDWKTFIAPMRSPFWGLYANKLRVYGTDTEICDLKTPDPHAECRAQ